MCGIAGSLVFKNSSFELTDEFLRRMRDTMIHRGPDGAGLWISENRRIGFGHRRLSIIDLSDAAAQPMSAANETLWITFNGEIYNHAELRAELIALGHSDWKTDHSDTEVILHAFAEWGIDCLERLRGMFAFALWDGRSRELWLVRDRLGVKPLYYSVHHGRLNFASEIKALLEDPDQQRKLHEDSLFHYLSFLTTPAPQTLFDGIKKLSAGTWIRIQENGNIQEQRYWDVLNHTVDMGSCSEGEIIESIRAELRDAVRYRSVSDVPVGVFLSGGLDSSINTALFSKLRADTVKTFTIGYLGQNSSYPNEAEYAHTVADLFSAKYHEKNLNVDDLLDFLPQMVQLQDEPIADPVCVPVYYLAKMARGAGVTVCQVGEGADELFCGYPGWKTLLKLQNLNDFPVPTAVKKLGLGGLRAVGRGEKFYYEWLRRGSEGQPIFWGGAEAFTEAQKQRLLSPRMRLKYRKRSSWEAIKGIHKRYLEGADSPSHLGWMSYLDLNFRLPELLLMRVDKMSMGASLEARVPFLDHNVVQLAMGIPERLKLKNGTLKYILKESARDLLPEGIIDRPKQGFGVPIHEWFFDKLGGQAHEEISNFCRHTDVLDPRAVSHLQEQGKSQQLWYLMNLAMWWKQYVAV